MSRTAAPIVRAPDERATLDAWTRGRRLSHRKVVRAKITAMAADKVPRQDIAMALKVSRPTVQLRRERFLALRVTGLEQDAPRPGRKPRVSGQKIHAVVDATLHTTPPAATHWSTRTLARAQGLSQATVQRIWKRHNLQPHRAETFKLSRDKHFLEKLTDVVGLHLDRPDKLLVLCVDENRVSTLAKTTLTPKPGKFSKNEREEPPSRVRLRKCQ